MVENALPWSIWSCRKDRITATKHWKGISCLAVHQRSNTPHLHSYSDRVDRALEFCIVLRTLSGRSAAFIFSHSLARPTVPGVLDEDRKSPPPPPVTEDLCTAAGTMALHTAWEWSLSANISLATAELPVSFLVPFSSLYEGLGIITLLVGMGKGECIYSQRCALILQREEQRALSMILCLFGMAL